jgi:hypothetical protein
MVVGHSSIKGSLMSSRKKPRRGAGRSEGKSSRPVEAGDAAPEKDVEGQIEIPIGTPVSADEMQRLKKAAERHSVPDDEEGRTQSDAT